MLNQSILNKYWRNLVRNNTVFIFKPFVVQRLEELRRIENIVIACYYRRVGVFCRGKEKLIGRPPLTVAQFYFNTRIQLLQTNKSVYRF